MMRLVRFSSLDESMDATVGGRRSSRPGTGRVINLALQGGGAHGAFTWGALDRLLEEDEIDIEGISATSAGAMNAVALKHGWVLGGREGARDWLASFWLRLTGLDGAFGEAVMDWLRLVSPSPALTARLLELSPAALAADAITRVLSPYQFNPTNYHPLRGIVDEMVCTGCTGAARGPKLFVTATNVRDGKPRVFQGKEITTDAVLASACLPTLYQAIEIDDPKTGRREAYWDGGYMGNPALYPLFYRTRATDIVIVHINPLYREELPKTASEIVSRINEISFNASLLRELRNIDFVNRLIDTGVIAEGAMKRNHVHSVSDDTLMNQLGMVTKLTISRILLLQLKDAGRAAMDHFLNTDGRHIGKRSSVDLRAMFMSEGATV
jgi:NTE family protein